MTEFTIRVNETHGWVGQTDLDAFFAAGYGNSKKIWFSVANRDNRYTNKEWVIGLEKDGVARAWPFSELETVWKKAPQKPYVEDSFNGEPVRIYYQLQNRSARIKSAQGQLLNGISAYWFAWIAFHPESGVFAAP